MAGYSGVPERDDTDIIGSRIGAAIIDSIIGFVLMFGTIVAFGSLGIASSGQSTGAAAGFFSFGLLMGLLVFIAYFFLLEGLWDGYTVGKKVLGIKVVKEDGSGCTVGSSIVRNLLRIIDGLFYYAVGFLFMAMSDKRQRLGDRLAGTVVVRE